MVAEALPSDKTSNEIFRKATQFEMDASEDKEFLEIVKPNGINRNKIQA